MRREELELAIATAARIVQQDRVLVIGSQAILGSYSEDVLPERATMSREADIAPLEDDAQESLATRIDVLVGEWSPFDDEHGFYVQGVSVRTAYLPEGWAERVVRVEVEGGSTGLCLEPHDLCAAKLGRNDIKDKEFVHALITAGLIDPTLLGTRFEAIADQRLEGARRVAVRSFLRSYVDGRTVGEREDRA
ncbi:MULTISPECIES: DUF6036 family nucleotidyltransferase [unclassified Rathayibacter]|jgi:hypothetical protein|uniref:DUF6036 family nucleotidyltransferase n=1 Tax=unclassified Rathayibacter TaxID=2609250 RepID=UPI000AB1F02C|nr:MULTISPECIES: DUF6036 family nucleotidyltransferase [unclassified Rathayibacter]